MRNKFILLTVLLATSLLSNAQLYLGAKVGLNVANVTASFPKTSFSTKMGINGGATLKYKFASSFGLQMDLLYSQMGSQSKKVEVTTDPLIGTTTTTTETVYDLSYFQIPIYANIEIPIKSEKLIPYRVMENVVSIHFFGGGYFGYGLGNNISTSVKTSLIDIDNNNVPQSPIPKVSGAAKKFNGIDYGIAAGAGVSFNLSKVGKLTVDIRYLLGMGNFNSNKAFNDGTGKYPIMTNSAPQIQIGYIHKITKSKRW